MGGFTVFETGSRIVSCPAPSNAKSEKGSGQTCIGPVSQRIIELPMCVNKKLVSY